MFNWLRKRRPADEPKVIAEPIRAPEPEPESPPVVEATLEPAPAPAPEPGPVIEPVPVIEALAAPEPAPALEVPEPESIAAPEPMGLAQVNPPPAQEARAEVIPAAEPKRTITMYHEQRPVEVSPADVPFFQSQGFLLEPKADLANIADELKMLSNAFDYTVECFVNHCTGKEHIDPQPDAELHVMIAHWNQMHDALVKLLRLAHAGFPVKQGEAVALEYVDPNGNTVREMVDPNQLEYYKRLRLAERSRG